MSDFSTIPELDFTDQRTLADVATSECDTRLALTEYVQVDSNGVSREYGFTAYTPDMADLVTVLPLDSLRVLRDALSAVIDR
ncbi:hypothetical protein [Saccharopolyspora sp. NPDC002376]